MMEKDIGQNGRTPNLGRYTPIFHFFQGQPTFTLGPGYIWSLVLILLLDAVSLFILFNLNSKGQLYTPYYNVQQTTTIIVNVCYLLAMAVNPGIVSVAQPYQTNQFCNKCNVFKQAGQRHCDACGICIRKAAHHCPLLGTHIGANNQIIFFLFVLGMFLWCTNLTVSLSVCLSKKH